MKVLLSGCSLSDYCGWNRIGDHSDPRCWYNIVAKKHNLQLNNVSYGGRSNQEILKTVSQEVLLDNYRLVIVQLTVTDRYWFYRTSNALEYCISNGPGVFNTKTDQELQALKIMKLEFSNTLVEIEKDLTNLVLFQRYLKHIGTELILIDAMGTLFDMKLLRGSQGRYMTPELKQHAGADRYLDRLSRLSRQLDLSNTIGIGNSWIAQMLDQADDDIHPGEQSNQLYASQVCELIERIYE